MQRDNELIEEFNKFIKKWCGSNYPHLIDTDDNDGEKFRNMLRKKQPTNLVGLDKKQMSDEIFNFMASMIISGRNYEHDEEFCGEFAEYLCSRFGQRTVELLSVEEIYAIINSYKMFDKFTVNGISQRIHSAMQEKIGEKK